MGAYQQQKSEVQINSATAEKNVAQIIEPVDQTVANVTTIDRWLFNRITEITRTLPVNISLWNGLVHQPEFIPVAEVCIADRTALCLLLVDPERYFGELYTTGRIEIKGDLTALLQVVLPVVTSDKYKPAKLLSLIRARQPKANTLHGSKDNIYHHYDIGNKFYGLWLDTAHMQYTCAYFPEADLSLEQAQEAKLHHICRKLALRPGDTVVEAGCGWGGLARFMAKHYDVKVRAYNISHQQIVYARSQALLEGLADKVEYVESDYRHIDGQYDVFVSVGMLEHVGKEQFPELGAVIDRCLKPGGRGLVHSIGRNKPRLMNAWTERRIFPGAYPPSLKEMVDIFEPYDFSVQDVENLRLHYASTLQHWLERYESHIDQIREMFDESFVCTWRLYLAGSIAAFKTGKLQLFQMAFTRPENNALPRSRAHLYKDNGVEERTAELTTF